MNVGIPSGVLGSAAGAPLSQTAGAETERTQKDSSARERQIDAQTKSEKAAGIGATEQDEQTGERDADGRRLWEQDDRKPTAEAPSEGEAERKPKDATGMSGNSLDLTG